MSASRAPTFWPPIQPGSVLADPDGRLWILPTTSTNVQNGLTYDIVNRKGDVTERVQLPKDRALAGFGPHNAVYMTRTEGTNTYLEELNPQRLSGVAEARFVIDSLDLVEGTYKLDIAVHKIDGFPYDYEGFGDSRIVTLLPGDDVIARLQIERVAIVKVDVEGGELEVLRGLEQTPAP